MHDHFLKCTTNSSIGLHYFHQRLKTFRRHFLADLSLHGSSEKDGLPNNRITCTVYHTVYARVLQSGNYPCSKRATFKREYVSDSWPQKSNLSKSRIEIMPFIGKSNSSFLIYWCLGNVDNVCLGLTVSIYNIWTPNSCFQGPGKNNYEARSYNQDQGLRTSKLPSFLPGPGLGSASE